MKRKRETGNVVKRHLAANDRRGGRESRDGVHL